MHFTVYRRVKGAPSALWVEKVERVIAKTLPKNTAHAPLSCAVIFIGEARMRTLNRQYHGGTGATDVLAFPELEEIFLCWPYIKKQAVRFGVSEKEECARILTHGVLHILGYDHDTKLHAKKMFGMQEKVVARWR